MSDLHFDQHIFAGRQAFPVDAEYTQEGWASTGVDFSDYQRMNLHNRSLRNKRWTPAFAASAEMLRAVLLERGRLYISATHPKADWQSINAAATKKALNPNHFPNCPAHKRHEHEAHAAAVKRAGGYLAMQAALAYRAWRLGQDSVTVGESVGMTPQCVRKNIHRLCEVARCLGFETFARHRSYNPNAARHIKIEPFNDSRAVELYKAGLSPTRIAMRFGYKHGNGNKRVARVLIKAGVYKRA